jgi:methylthioribose-1-phosphate isomerase
MDAQSAQVNRMTSSHPPHSSPPTVTWIGEAEGHIRLIDQTRLPGSIEFCDCRNVHDVWEAIKTLRVRGAPAIGVTAALGIVVGLGNRPDPTPIADAVSELSSYLQTSRPTAVNLFWALERMRQKARSIPVDVPWNDARRLLWQEALAILQEDRECCHRIGEVGAKLIQDGMGVLTHCNAGGLCASEYGTALGVLFRAHEQGKQFHVYVDETRPLLQGARLTTWELQRRQITTTLICDSMAAAVMREGRIQLVIVGADRIAANGDTANKIGTYGLAVLARAHAIPMYVAAPATTFDRELPDGSRIPIEIRDGKEITRVNDADLAPEGVEAYNPAFDVTPAEFITGIITERGLIQPVNRTTIEGVLGAAVSRY